MCRRLFSGGGFYPVQSGSTSGMTIPIGRRSVDYSRLDILKAREGHRPDERLQFPIAFHEPKSLRPTHAMDLTIERVPLEIEPIFAGIRLVSNVPLGVLKNQPRWYFGSDAAPQF
jgi:hypothetical protein